jgi:hypothetical protein
MKKLLLTGLLGAGLFAQEAVVHRIPEADAAKLKTKYEALKKALKEFEETKYDVEKELTEKQFKETGNISICATVEFTPDFKLAVPKGCTLQDLMDKMSKDADPPPNTKTTPGSVI